MLPTDEYLRHRQSICPIHSQPVLQLPVIVLVHIDVFLHHLHPKVVQHGLDVAAVLKGAPNPSETGDVEQDLPCFPLFLQQSVYTRYGMMVQR